MSESCREWFTLFSEFCSVIGAPSALISLILLYRQWLENRRLNQTVSVVLECAEKKRKIEANMRMRRRDVTRAEIQGILRTIKMKEPNPGFYKLSYLDKEEYWKAIEHVQESDSATLVIPCSGEEIEQFDSGPEAHQYP